MKAIPNYHPPSDYRRPTKTQEKIYVPVNDYPEINFSILTPLLTILLLHITKMKSPVVFNPKVIAGFIDCLTNISLHT